jgi:1-acyl-sn-glycerol-3-phosphate acyltransferase
MFEEAAQRLAEFLKGVADPAVLARMDRVDARLNEFGVDPFGFDPEMAKAVAPIIQFLYQRYFRVETQGLEHVPRGRVLLISNHSGQLPIDAMMICAAMVLEAEPPRVVRSMVETWVPSLPFVSHLFARWGQIVGTRENCLRLLQSDQPILAFPEGVRGINKTFGERYQLQEFGLGFMRLALMARAPIVPVAVVGAEEQTISVYNARGLARLLGLPNLPITPLTPLLGPLALLPLPTRYRLRFGKPLAFEGDPDDEDSVIADKVKRVRQTIARMLHDGLKARRHVFW